MLVRIRKGTKTNQENRKSCGKKRMREKLNIDEELRNAVFRLVCLLKPSQVAAKLNIFKRKYSKRQGDKTGESKKKKHQNRNGSNNSRMEGKNLRKKKSQK